MLEAGRRSAAAPAPKVVPVSSAVHPPGPALRAGCPHGVVTDLLLRCGRGEAAALARLFDLFYRPVHAVVASRVPTDRTEAAMAEVFVRIWRRSPGYRPALGSAVGWIMQEAEESAPGTVHLAATRPALP